MIVAALAPCRLITILFYLYIYVIRVIITVSQNIYYVYNFTCHCDILTYIISPDIVEIFSIFIKTAYEIISSIFKLGNFLRFKCLSVEYIFHS